MPSCERRAVEAPQQARKGPVAHLAMRSPVFEQHPRVVPIRGAG